MFTLFSTVSPTARPIPVDIEFSSRPPLDDGACSAMATCIIRSAKGEKQYRLGRTCPPGSANAWSGTWIGLPEQSGKQTIRIHYCDCAARAGAFGPANTLMTMCGGCARDGN